MLVFRNKSKNHYTRWKVSRLLPLMRETGHLQYGLFQASFGLAHRRVEEAPQLLAFMNRHDQSFAQSYPFCFHFQTVLTTSFLTKSQNYPSQSGDHSSPTLTHFPRVWNPQLVLVAWDDDSAPQTWNYCRCHRKAYLGVEGVESNWRRKVIKSWSFGSQDWRAQKLRDHFGAKKQFSAYILINSPGLICPCWFVGKDSCKSWADYGSLFQQGLLQGNILCYFYCRFLGWN